MTLDEWQSLAIEARTGVDAATYHAIAQAAAKELLARNLWSAQHVYVADRFGELILEVYVPDAHYSSFASGWERHAEQFYGFRCFIDTVRRMNPGLEAYAEQYFFTNPRCA